jgi:L-ascorbate metabolism protein UlaG (beta-lactamase superfamily)
LGLPPGFCPSRRAEARRKARRAAPLPFRSQLALLLMLALLRPFPVLAQQTEPGTRLVASINPLSIRVLEGQNAVNDVRAGMATTPRVGVHDENGQPVLGAEVTFELPGSGPGGSFHGWMRAQTLRTDAAGQVTASGYAPNAETGGFEIRVTANSGSKTGEASIIQTNGPVPEGIAAPRRKFKNRKLVGMVGLGLVAFSITLAVRTLKRDKGRWLTWLSLVGNAGIVLWILAGVTTGARTESDKFTTANGPITVTPIHHASLMIRSGGAVVHVDPAGETEYEGRPKADLVLITDAYSDHFDPAVLARLSKAGTVVYGPEAAARSLPQVSVFRNGETRIWRQWSIEAVPAYNLPRGDAPGRVFHEKGHGNGYVLTFGGRRLYISGNTGNTPELRGLGGVDVAFLCMNPPYTMSAEEAVEAVRAFKPKVVYPYHYRGNLLSVFRLKDALADTGTDIRIRNWYE